MAVGDPEDFELRRRIEMLERVLEVILATDGRWLDPEIRYSLDTGFLGRPSSKRFSPDFSYLLERYVHRRDYVLDEFVNQMSDAVRSSQVEFVEVVRQVSAAAVETSEKQAKQILSIEAQSKANAQELHQWLTFRTLGIGEDEVRTTRFVPMRAYLSDIPERGLDEVTSAVDAFIEAFGFEMSDEFPEIRGSWFKKWFVKTKELASQPEVADRLAKVERALALKGLNAPQAEIDSKQANAVAALATAFADVPTVAMQVGSILFLKLTANGEPIVQVRTLTQRELIVLENNQDLLNSPTTIMAKLAKMCHHSEADAPSINITGNGAPVATRVEDPEIWERLKSQAAKPSTALVSSSVIPRFRLKTPQISRSEKDDGDSDDDGG